MTAQRVYYKRVPVFVKEKITAIELIVKSQCQTAEQTILANASQLRALAESIFPQLPCHMMTFHQTARLMLYVF